jgi:hypothetical protein
METIIPVSPVEMTRTCRKVRMTINNFQLNATDCTVSVIKYDENEQFLENVGVYISPEEYSEWGRDDTYIINLVLEKIGLVREQVEEVV